MRSAITIFTLLFILQQHCRAQTIKEFLHKRDSIEKLKPAFEHSLIKLGGGISFPQNTYARTDGYDSNVGYAMPGAFGELEYTYLIFRNAGVGISAFAALHAVDESAVTASYEDWVYQTTFSLSATPYFYRSIMLHIFLTHGFGFFHVDAKLMAGYGLLRITDIEGTAINDGVSHHFTQDGSQGFARNFGAEFSLRFDIARHFSLHLSESCIKGNDFGAGSNFAYTYDVGWPDWYRRPLRIANTSLGLTYSF